jgi:HlyD family type I secretion membrane fusion protein
MSTLISSPRRPSEPAAPLQLTFESATAEVLAEHHPVLERATLFALASMVALFMVFISFKTLDRVVTATGRIVPVSGNLTVQPLEKAIISHIYVSPGDVVRKGQILATCDPTFVHADLVGMQAKVDSLLAQERRMEGEESGRGASGRAGEPDEALQAEIRQKREAEYRSGVNDFDQRISSAESEIAGLKANIANYSSRLKIESEQEKMFETLEQQQVTSHLQSMVQRDQALETERLLATAQNSLNSELHGLESLKEQRKMFVDKWHDDNLNSLVDVKTQLDAAENDLAKAKKLNDLINLVAPADAVVLKIPDISQGGVAGDAEPLFSLIALDAPIEADVAIDAKDVGFVKVGDKVRIKLDAFRFMEHGIAEGVVKTISQDSFTEASTQDALTRSSYNRSGGATVAPYFETRIKLTSVKLRNVPPNTRLTPGMTLQAEIVVGHRTILWYILGDALGAGSEGMREP